MESVIIILKQIIVMFLLMAVGFILYKKNKISKEGSKGLANLLIYLILPAVIINGFLVECTSGKIMELLVSAVLAILCLLVSIAVSRVLFRDNPIDRFASSFSNPGFFGIPLIVASFDTNAVFCITAFIAFLNIGQWTYGAALLEGKKVKVNIKNIILSPFMVGMITGLALFFSQITVPEVIKTALTNICNANTLTAMLVLGIYLAQADLRDIFTNVKVYFVSVSRLIIIPLLSLLLLSPVPETYHVLKVCVLIAAACPVGANVAVYAQLYNKNYSYAVETITLSTIFSIVTMPLIILLAEHIWT